MKRHGRDNYELQLHQVRECNKLERRRRGEGKTENGDIRNDYNRNIDIATYSTYTEKLTYVQNF